MAQEIIGIGTSPNDGTGDTLREAMIKTNNNFTTRFDVDGWGFYTQTAGTQIFSTTPSKMIIDGTGANTNTAYLPKQIRGVSELWDTGNNKIIPINLGDGYSIRIEVVIIAKSGVPTQMDISLDISGNATPDTIISQTSIATGKTPPYVVSSAFPVFTLNTFVANGGQIFMSTDTGTVTVDVRQIQIHRISSNGL